MLLGLIARLRRHRCAAAVIAAALLVLQALLGGVAMAQAAIALTPERGGAATFAVICHGNGGPASDSGTAPGPAKDRHPCCVSCAAGGAPAMLPAPPLALSVDRKDLSDAPSFPVASIWIAPRALRDGRSQAPPSRG
jgi:hypothetical protein